MGSNSNQFTHIVCVFTVAMKEKSAENVIQVYLSGILALKGSSVAILSPNGIDFIKQSC